MPKLSLPYFPDKSINITHDRRDYLIVLYAFFAVTVCFLIDSVASIQLQYALGFVAWMSLLFMLWRENTHIRIQVLIAVAFATIGEHFASIYMSGYTYRLENVPSFVPPGHGIVYLTAVVLGRTVFFQKNARMIALFVFIVGGLWAVLALTGTLGRKDEIGAILFAIYLIFLFKGKSPMVYLGAFFITTWVEIVGTSVGTWNWAAIDPASTLAQGNPPSGVAAWYCLVDAVALTGSSFILNIMTKFKKNSLAGYTEQTSTKVSIKDE